MDIPRYWKSDLDTVEKLARSARRAQVGVLTPSAGGRPVWCFAFGRKEAVKSTANYSSACGAGDRTAYAPRKGKQPAIMLVGGIHGQETEGIVALNNLISLLETGRDLGGQANDALTAAAEGVRLLVIPVANPDGRARVKPPAMLGLTGEQLRYWGQGTWKDGTLCGWPGCKKTHPILNAAEFLGGYFNDQGVNLMHDQFFRPMARETQALLNLAADEYADCVVLLHGGSNSANALVQPAYVPVEVNRTVLELARRCHERACPLGLEFNAEPVPPPPSEDTPPRFNLTSALHHVCGGVSFTFESNQCIIDEPGPHYCFDQVKRSHEILFEEILGFFVT
jgi:hypothetical protein